MFVAALLLNAVLFLSLGLLVMALGILVLVIPPTFEEFARMVCFLLLCLVYIAFWLNHGILFSVVFRQAATSALSSMAVWLFFNLFYSMIVEVFAKSFLQFDAITSVEQAVGRQELVLGLMRLSPSYLFNESTTAFFAGRPNARDRHGGANGRRCCDPLAILAKFAAHLAAGDRAHCRHSHLLCDRVLVVYEAGDTGGVGEKTSCFRRRGGRDVCAQQRFLSFGCEKRSAKSCPFLLGTGFFFFWM